ncbi:hypothetical protein GQR58_014094 [Nymphon striatum]|nr:hypothetical protein GQR58_025829 [Nymphon striatum]KAG1676907.1 hypothetical protein GQR58_014094 [Nymphon striatum]
MPHNNDNGGIYKSTSDTVQGKMLTSSNDVSIKNYPEPYKMSALPGERVQPTSPNIHVRDDVAGPLFIRILQNPNSITNLELVCDMSTDSFIRALKIMTGLRSSFSIVFCRGSMNVVVLNINGGGADVSETAPLNIDEEEAGVMETTPKQGNNYFIHEYSGEISVNGAIDGCLSENGQAVEPETLVEAEELKQLVTEKSGNSDDFFVPTRLKYENGQFVFADSTPYTGSIQTYNADTSPDQTNVYLTFASGSFGIRTEVDDYTKKGIKYSSAHSKSTAILSVDNASAAKPLPTCLAKPFLHDAENDDGTMMDSDLFDEFVVLQSDDSVKPIHAPKGQQMWMDLQVSKKYEILVTAAHLKLFPFLTTYLVKCVFSAVTDILTKKRGRLENSVGGDLRSKLTRFIPQFSSLIFQYSLFNLNCLK